MESPVAIITGAGRGIGRATAVTAAKAGYRVIAVSRSEADIAETIRLIGGGGLAIPLDVTDPPQVDRMIDQTLRRFGRIDAVVNNAGVAPSVPLAEMSIEQWRTVIDTNLSSAFYLIRAVWPTFKQQGGGAVVNISSAAARDPFAGLGAYGAAKSGLNLLGLAAAREGQPIGVRVHTIAPGATETAMFRQLADHSTWPTEKTLDPSEVADVVIRCLRGELAHTSGEVIYLHKTL